MPTFQATFGDGRDATEELRSFAQMIGLESIIFGRYSALLLCALFCGFKAGTLNPAKVVSQIKVLEGLEMASGLKAATLFKRAPLRGLWHQHYLEDGLACMAQNVRRGVDKFGLPWVEQKIAEAKASGEERYITREDVAHIAHDAVAANWERLQDSEALTGEWIIFAKHKGKNYYLCLGKHDSGDHVLRAQIEARCVYEFPFLREILK